MAKAGRNPLASILAKHIDAAVAEALEAYRALTNGLATRPRTDGRTAQEGPKGVKAAGARKGKRARRTATDIAVTIDKVLAFITANPGMRAEEITRKVGGNKAATKDALARLRATGKLQTRGTKRAMTYAP